MGSVRTTIELPDDLHRIASAIARDKSQTLSQTVAELLRRALAPAGTPDVSISSKTGLPVIRLGRIITVDDVRSLDDE